MITKFSIYRDRGKELSDRLSFRLQGSTFARISYREGILLAAGFYVF